MASGPYLPSGNRFSILDQPSNSPKRKKNKPSFSPIDQSTSIPINSCHIDPKFILLSSLDPNKPLSSFSVFLIKKAIDGISTSYENISQLRDGNLLILVKSQKIADLFLSKKTLSNICPISVTLHSTLNSSKGTVYAPCLINVSEEEILSEMQNQGVTQVYKFKKTLNEESRATGLVLFTFNRFRPPTSVNIGWYNLQVQEYFPNPMRCKNCQLLGHTAKRCNRNKTCVNCNLPPHPDSNCTRTSCANCSEEHAASFKHCKRFMQDKEIIKIKTIKKCTLAEAKQIYNDQNPIPFSSLAYSSAVKGNPRLPSATPASNSNNNLPSSQHISSQSNSANNHNQNTSKTTINNSLSNPLSTDSTKSIPPTKKNSNSIPSSLPLNSTTNSHNLSSLNTPTLSRQNLTQTPTSHSKQSTSAYSVHSNSALNTNSTSPQINSISNNTTKQMLTDTSDNYYESIDDDEI